MLLSTIFQIHIGRYQI